MENYLICAYFFVVFLFIGSFFNVVAFRTLEGTTVLHPKHSHCPHCQKRLTYLELIPLFSWLLLGGKCRTCKQPISWLYAAGELGTALVLTFVLGHAGLSWEALVQLVLFSFLLLVTLTDLRAKRMPNKILFPGMAVLLLLRLFIHPQPLWVYLLGFLIGGLLLTLLALVPNGMGGGDIKLFALLGLGLGWKWVLFALLFSCVWGTVIGLPLKWLGFIKPKQPIPFGPFILLGTGTAWAYGAAIWQAYWQWLFE